MSIERPFRQCVRPFVNGEYSAPYIAHDAYALHASSSIRSFELIQRDMLTMFEYVEPADANLAAYSLRTMELLVRTCTEIEANFRSIFAANKYKRFADGCNLGVRDFYKVDATHFLSRIAVQYPHWTGVRTIWKPFAYWSNPHKPDAPWVLPWYQAYNSAKHDRTASMSVASVECLVEAFAALYVLLTSQYLDGDFQPGQGALMWIGRSRTEQFRLGIGGYLSHLMPKDVPSEARYDFEWNALNTEDDPFARIDYDAL